MEAVNRRRCQWVLYYHERRVHQSLEMDCPKSREVHSVDRGPVVEIPETVGLHHRDGRATA